MPRTLFVVAFCLVATAAVAEDFWQARATSTGTTSARYCYGTSGTRFGLALSKNAWCEFGYKLADAGTQSTSDAGAPLIAVANSSQPIAATPGTGPLFHDQFIAGGSAYPHADNCLACIANVDDGGTLTIDFFRSGP